MGRGKFPIKGNPTLGAGRARVSRPNNKAITIDDARTAIIRVYRHPRKRGYVTVWTMQLIVFDNIQYYFQSILLKLNEIGNEVTRSYR